MIRPKQTLKKHKKTPKEHELGQITLAHALSILPISKDVGHTPQHPCGLGLSLINPICLGPSNALRATFTFWSLCPSPTLIREFFWDPTQVP